MQENLSEFYGFHAKLDYFLLISCMIFVKKSYIAKGPLNSEMILVKFLCSKLTLSTFMVHELLLLHSSQITIVLASREIILTKYILKDIIFMVHN